MRIKPVFGGLMASLLFAIMITLRWRVPIWIMAICWVLSFYFAAIAVFRGVRGIKPKEKVSSVSMLLNILSVTIGFAVFFALLGIIFVVLAALAKG